MKDFLIVILFILVFGGVWMILITAPIKQLESKSPDYISNTLTDTVIVLEVAETGHYQRPKYINRFAKNNRLERFILSNNRYRSGDTVVITYDSVYYNFEEKYQLINIVPHGKN